MEIEKLKRAATIVFNNNRLNEIRKLIDNGVVVEIGRARFDFCPDFYGRLIKTIRRIIEEEKQLLDDEVKKM